MRNKPKIKNRTVPIFLVFWFFGFSFLAAEEVTPLALQKEKVSLDLQSVEINEVFRILALKSGLNIIATPEVQGRVTVFLNNLTFEDAFDIIITKQGLAYERKDNIIKVMTAAEYEKAFGKKFGERTETKTFKLKFAKPANIVNVISFLKSDIGKITMDEPSGTLLLIDTPQSISLMEETIKELDQPLETAVFDINYAKAQDIKTYLSALITPEVGQIIIDERNNKAIVSDLPDRLVKITKLMRELDEASRQVLLCAEIVQVNLNDKFYRGIEWEKIFTEKKFDSLDFVGEFPVSPALSNYGKLNIGTLSKDEYSLILNLLEEYGDTRTISRPRILAVSNEEAKILVGTREAYITQSLSQAETTTVKSESVEFIDVGVKLNVVPKIGSDGFITMKIKPEISSVASTLTTSGGSQIPIVQTSEAETVVKVKDGTMIIIAGLMKEERKDSIAGLPGIAKLPFLGTAFGSRTKQNPITELIVFLTPQLISGDLKREAKIEN